MVPRQLRDRGRPTAPFTRGQRRQRGHLRRHRTRSREGPKPSLAASRGGPAGHGTRFFSYINTDPGRTEGLRLGRNPCSM